MAAASARWKWLSARGASQVENAAWPAIEWACESSLWLPSICRATRVAVCSALAKSPRRSANSAAMRSRAGNRRRPSARTWSSNSARVPMRPLVNSGRYASPRTCSIISARSNLRISLIAVSHADTSSATNTASRIRSSASGKSRASRPGNHEAEDEARVRLEACVTAPSANISSRKDSASSPNARRMSLGRRLGRSAAVERASRNRGSADPISSSAKKSYSADGSDASGGFALGVRAANPSTAGQPRASPASSIQERDSAPSNSSDSSAVIARSSRVSSKTSP